MYESGAKWNQTLYAASALNIFSYPCSRRSQAKPEEPEMLLKYCCVCQPQERVLFSVTVAGMLCGQGLSCGRHHKKVAVVVGHQMLKC